jgi:alpha-D-ribose 1-methylphosphonate 5-triphosphate synthase subunit PhnG
MSDANGPSGDQAVRRAAMAVLAESETAEIATRIAALGELPAHENARQAESGLLMMRGRISGDGSPFNVGELTVSRAAVRLASNELGFGYVLGRDHEKARLVALCDALLQTENYREGVERQVIEPLKAAQYTKRKLAADRTAATRVEFFTLVRGEDEK